jgi:CelD/BcsL family acetyltransferase involved in cellulose biosynthesis
VVCHVCISPDNEQGISMPAPRVIRFESTAALQSNAEQWDDLCQRSEGVLPTSGATLIVDWLDQFAPRANFVALAVEQDGQLVAALPLMQRRLARLISVGSLPSNTWCWAGDLLLDLTCDVPRVMAALAAEIRKLPWPLLWIDAVPLEETRWKQLLEALDVAGLGHIQHERFRIGQVGIVDQLDRDWKAYEQAWSGNHRRHMRKAVRRAEEAGGVELDLQHPQSAQELESLLREGFEVEHHSWKGTEGSSVVANPKMWNFYLRQATQLAKQEKLELAFLRHQDKAIAFEYGWSDRGIYYTPKAGFDDAFAQFTPGQLLRYLMLKDAFTRADRSAVDFLGPLSEATARWTTRTYPICRLAVETGSTGGKSLLWAYRNVYGRIRKLRNSKCSRQALKFIELDSASDTPLPEATVGA